MKSIEQAMTFTVLELDLIRQWYNAVQDLNPKYLDSDGFQDSALYNKVLKMLSSAKDLSHDA